MLVIETAVVRIGLGRFQFGVQIAVGLLQSVVGLILIVPAVRSRALFRLLYVVGVSLTSMPELIGRTPSACLS